MKRYNFICENGHDNFYYECDEQPFACSFCSVAFEEERVNEVETIDLQEVVKLTIICQITQQQIEITSLNKTILGRSNHGSEVLSKILFNGSQVISRVHCSIEYKEGNLLLLDEGSTNGTFYGVNKVSCKNSPQIIEDGSLIWLGREAFKVRLQYKTKVNEVITAQSPVEIIEEIKAIKQYKCRGCGKNFEEYSEECPNCERYKTIIPIY